MTTLLFTRMFPDVLAPRLGTPNSVGADIHAYCKTETGRPSKIMIPAKATRAIPTGLVVAVPQSVPVAGYVAPEPMAIFVCSRSGLAREKSIFVTNSPGIIDPDYRGEILVLLYNGGHEAHYVQHDDRIAQLVLVPTPRPYLQESPVNLQEEQTTRGAAGFGSTGR